MTDQEKVQEFERKLTALLALLPKAKAGDASAKLEIAGAGSQLMDQWNNMVAGVEISDPNIIATLFEKFCDQIEKLDSALREFK